MDAKALHDLKSVVVAAAGSALLGACASSNPAMPGPAAMGESAALGQAGFAEAAPSAQFLRPGDIISLVVFREPEMSLSSVPVAADGLISMPLVGPIAVAGKTAAEVEHEIESLLNSRYLRKADVAVNVLEYGSHLVTVEGAVAGPGVFPFQPGTRLSGSVAMAEGLTRVADRSEVAIFRQSREGIQIAKFDYGAVMAGTMLDPVLQPGDRVVVGTDNLSQFWQDLLTTLPAFALFTNVNF